MIPLRNIYSFKTVLNSISRSQYYSANQTHVTQKKKSPTCSNRGWRSTFISLVITAVLLLFTVIALGLWKYLMPRNSQPTQSQPTQSVVTLSDPITCNSDTSDIGMPTRSNVFPPIKSFNFRFTFWFTKWNAIGRNEEVDSHWRRLLSNHVLDIKRRNSFDKIPNGPIKLSNGSDWSKRSHSKSFKSQFSWHDR